MRIGLLYSLGPDALDDSGGSYETALSQIEEADRLGLDSVLFEEHHGRRGCPAPGSLAAAAAARTGSIRIGSLNCHATLEFPINVAEDWAVLDLISRGRAILGVTPGDRATDFRAAGAAWEARTSRFAEAVELIRTAWTQASFQFVGEHYRFPHGVDGQPGWRREPADSYLEQWRRGQTVPSFLPVTPRPVQLPHPPIWVHTWRLDTAEWAARRGLPLIVPSLLGDDEVHTMISRYDEALHACGRSRNEVDVVVAREVFVDDDGDRARERALPSLLAHVQAFRAEAVEDAADWAISRGEPDGEKLLETCFIVGAPGEVANRLRILQADLGVTHVLGRVSLPGRSHFDVLNAIRLLASQVQTRLVA